MKLSFFTNRKKIVVTATLLAVILLFSVLAISRASEIESYFRNLFSAPSTALHTSPQAPDGDFGWFKKSPTVSFSTSEPCKTYYRLDSEATQSYSAPFTVPEGKHTLYYQSVDSGGKREEMKSSAIDVDSTPPRAPKVSSKTHPNESTWYSNNDPAFIWDTPDDLSGIQGYSFLFNKNPTKIPDEISDGNDSSTLFANRADGTRYFHVRSKDKAGNWGSAAHFKVNIDSFRPRGTLVIGDVLSGGSVIKYRLIEDFPARVRATMAVMKGKKVVKTLFHNDLRKATAGKGTPYKIIWNGKDEAGRQMVAGTYTIELQLLDLAGNENVFRKKLKISSVFEIEYVKKDIYALANKIGVRKAGSSAEHRAADYLESRLKNMGYEVERQLFDIPGNRVSFNVVARKAGSQSGKKLIFGAHYDSKSPSPGANDNASGVATLLELVRDVKGVELKPTVVFVFFGTEEIAGATPKDHHFGSHYYVNSMSAADKNETVGMISVDMVGYGSTFNVRSMQKGPMSMVNSLLGFSKKHGYRLRFLKDFGRYGWSDHEAFELAGLPVAWLEWREDPSYHSTGDNFGHMQWDRIKTTGDLLLSYLLEKQAQ